MISKKMTETLTKQINKELYSGYLYLAMASQAEHSGFKGTAQWFKVQAGEETNHAKKMYDYVQQQGEKVILQAIDQPPAEFASVLDMFEKTLAHEKAVTASINQLVDQANKENDHATAIMLQWFVTEQVEEEATPAEILQQLKAIGSSAGSLYMIDHHLGKRGK